MTEQDVEYIDDVLALNIFINRELKRIKGNTLIGTLCKNVMEYEKESTPTTLKEFDMVYNVNKDEFIVFDSEMMSRILK